MESGSEQWLTGVWGSSSNDIFAVGMNNTILHYDGNFWSPMAPPEHILPTHYMDVWGSSSDDVYAVTFSGIIAHYDGNKWSVASHEEGRLQGIWGSSATDVFAVGDEGLIVHKEYTLGGSVLGILPTVVLLHIQNADDPSDYVAIMSDGPFTLQSTVHNGDSYNIVADYHGMPRQTCQVLHGIGIVTDGNINNIDINCALSGDWDNDGEVDIQDVIKGINDILEGGQVEIGSDCNSDGEVNIQDIVCTINRILDPNS